MPVDKQQREHIDFANTYDKKWLHHEEKDIVFEQNLNSERLFEIVSEQNLHQRPTVCRSTS